MVVVFNLVYLDVVNVWVRSNYCVVCGAVCVVCCAHFLGIIFVHVLCTQCVVVWLQCIGL